MSDSALNKITFIKNIFEKQKKHRKAISSHKSSLANSHYYIYILLELLVFKNLTLTNAMLNHIKLFQS